MTSQFLQSGLWEKITSLAKQAKCKYVAVAYLGTGATEMLPLMEGDILIIDMSLPAVQAGQINPMEVEKYLTRGVEVHSCSNLHAKVFVFDDIAIVGSANVSTNSKNYLIEAAILTTDKNTVDLVKDFILSLKGEVITPSYIKICKSEYRPPRPPKGKPVRRVVPAHSRLRVERIYPTEFDSQEEELVERGLEAAEEEVNNTEWRCCMNNSIPT